MKNYSKELKTMNFAESIINGFRSIAEGMGSISLFPNHRYTKLNMEEYRNGFERDKKSLEEDWKALQSDWEKVCPFK